MTTGIFLLNHQPNPSTTEFNDDQRTVFCVFSGEGVGNLRDHLNSEMHVFDGEVTMYDDPDAGDEAMGDDIEERGLLGLMESTVLDTEEGDEDGGGFDVEMQ